LSFAEPVEIVVDPDDPTELDPLEIVISPVFNLDDPLETVTSPPT
jgi:hypothetical protein